MAEPHDDPPAPQVTRQNRLRLSLVWIVPIVAILAGVLLGLRTWLSTGPTITIEFRTAEGIEAGRTEVRYKEVVVGQVTSVSLSDDRERVIVTVVLDDDASDMAVEDSRFWVVRPRVGVAGISGLGTLLSGSYIGVDAGLSEERRRHFKGLEAPPFVLRGEPGRAFVLDARHLGSLDIGSPVYYRSARVGRVVGYELDPTKDALRVQVFIESPYEKLVTTQSRFWNASGVDVSLDAKGLTVNTESLTSVLAGGVSFLNPPGRDAPQADAGTVFRLHRDRRTALRDPEGPPLQVRFVFDPLPRGLDVGASVELLGFEIGSVESVALRHDEKTGRFPLEVMAEIQPRRIGDLQASLGQGRPQGVDPDAWLLKRLVDEGLRAQVRSGNLLTGQQYVALDFVPKAKPVSVQAAARPLTLPTVAGGDDDIQLQISQLVRRIGSIEFEAIGRDLQATLKSARRSSDTLNGTLERASATIDRLGPEAQAALVDVRRTLDEARRALAGIDRNITDANAPLQRNANQTLVELQRAARALRVLGEYLQAHPQSLLLGKPDDAELLEAPR